MPLRFCVMQGGIWGAYVRTLTEGVPQQQIAARAGVNQATVSRWIQDGYAPDKGGIVAAFCRGYDRNPIEGFVAAGMLTEAEAGRALSKREREFLAELREVENRAVEVARKARDTARSRRGPSHKPPQGSQSERQSQKPRLRGGAA